MNWFQQNRFLGTLLAVLGVATLACLIFLWLGKSRFDAATAQFDQQATEMSALQRHNPYPTEVNLRKMKTQAQEYATQLGSIKEDLKTHVIPPPTEMQPNEFQARLRQVMARPLFVDGRNAYDPEQITRAGFIYQGIGRRRPAPEGEGA